MFRYLIVTSMIFGISLAHANKDEEKIARKPASIEGELVQTLMKAADLYAQARNENLVCDVDAYQFEIIDILRKVQHRNGFSADMITQNIRNALAGTIAIKEFTGEVKLDGNASTEAYQKALTNTYFESPAAGVYGPPETFLLKSNGVVEFTSLEVLDKEPWTKYNKINGKWGVKVEKDVVRVWLTLNKKTRAYRLERSHQEYDNGWRLRTKGKPSDPEGDRRIQFYNGINSECEA